MAIPAPMQDSTNRSSAFTARAHRGRGDGDGEDDDDGHRGQPGVVGYADRLAEEHRDADAGRHAERVEREEREIDRGDRRPDQGSEDPEHGRAARVLERGLENEDPGDDRPDAADDGRSGVEERGEPAPGEIRGEADDRRPHGDDEVVRFQSRSRTIYLSGTPQRGQKRDCPLSEVRWHAGQRQF